MTSKLQAYRDFLARKTVLATSSGFAVREEDLNPTLMPHQRAIVRWACAGGNRAIFAKFGLMKSRMQIEILRQNLLRGHGEVALITAPLGMRVDFQKDADAMGVPLRFVQRDAEVDEPGLYLTNFESVREAKITPTLFGSASLDEASVLRGFGGTKTFREFMRVFEAVPHRYVATAIPDPNEHLELLAYAAFLGIMDVGQAKTRFFKRDSTDADNLTIHPHKVREFWLWVASWSVFLQRPSQLGFSDEGFDLPPMDIRYHEVAVDHRGSPAESNGQGTMFRGSVKGVVEASREKRDTIPARVARLAEIVAESPEDHFLLWHDLEAERKAIEDVLPSARWERWEEFKDGNAAALAMYERHYSARPINDRKLFVGPGQKLVLMTRKRDALFVWRKFIDDSGQDGINCAVFRNEGPWLSSELIREACVIAWDRWPGARLYTYVDADEVLSDNPGYCFQMAGWAKCGVTKGGLIILEMQPRWADDLRVGRLKRHRVSESVYGNQPVAEREEIIAAFANGEIQHLPAKPMMYGSGCNFQYHCHRAIFAGVGFKFNDFIQAIHRIWRFGQKQPVRIDIIHAESERDVLRELLAKWKQHEETMAKMGEIIEQYGLDHSAMMQELARSIGVERVQVRGERYLAVRNDCVEETMAMATDSVDLVLTSIPFSTQYEYTPSYNDFGHTDSNEHFFAQMDHLTPELLRVLKPGHVAAIHVKDRIVPGGINGLGFQSVYRFHAKVGDHFEKHGFASLGMKTIVTDVVRENNQTYRLSYTEMTKDATKMGVGSPEYLLLFRKPTSDTSNSYADERVTKHKKEYSLARWQLQASGFDRSSGQRLLRADELAHLDHAAIYKIWKAYNLDQVYDFEYHVQIGEAMERLRMLPTDFTLIPAHSWSPEVWSDVVRMGTMNKLLSQAGKPQHLCPLQFDICDRTIAMYSNPGETVYDPFGGVMTVPYRAIKMGRRGIGCELNGGYFVDGCAYLKMAEREMAMPTLFDTVDSEGSGLRDQGSASAEAVVPEEAGCAA